MMKEHEIVTLEISPRPLLLAISLNLVKVLEVLHEVEQSLSSSLRA